jgi:hypothetical protein
MRRLRYSLWLVLVALAGCQTHPQVNAHIDTVNAEYRQLEDYVYCLEDENAQLQQQLDALRAANAGAPPSGTGRGGFLRRRSDTAPRSRSGAADAIDDAPQIEVPGSSSPTPPPPTGGRSRLQRPDLSPPADSPPNLVPPVGELPPPAAMPAQIRPAGGERPLSAEAESTTPKDTKITHVTLSSLFTGGADFDSQPGDDGLCVVVEPRNAGEQYVPEAGPISIVVLDPSRQGDAARVARWDFDLSAARQKLAGSAVTTGIKLELPWPATPPTANRLHLFVRYETADGRKLQTDREIFLTPPGQVSSRWTPRTAERQRPAPTLTPVSAESTVAPTDSRLSIPGSRPVAESVPPPSLSSDESSASKMRPSWSPHR